ncbi:alpha-mannosidase [Serinibacter arcticus]|uniref:Alpha-mannosidase n=1 Tax=Serinibacter arcticus TaxID=1655435 RepID=A0A4Z1E1S8_9MICO|nr:glycoside hydrolase family 38 C-terminal domain-containing protein [Serinibacter arcticus]TGO05209.1 Alpha-mannosidase [Serinibacter arcticus]
MHDNSDLTLARIDRFVTEWIAPATYRDRHPLEVTSWRVPDEPVPFAQARAAQYAPHPVGTPWGTPWSTVWFHVTGEVPAAWPLPGTRVELDVDLGFIAQQPGFQAEGAAWSPDGVLLKGISPRNSFVPLPRVSSDGDADADDSGARFAPVDLYIEGAANPDVPGNQWTKPTRLGDKATSGDTEIYVLKHVDVALLDVDVHELVADAATLRGLITTLPTTSPRRAEVIRALEVMCDVVDPDDVSGTAAAGRAALADVLAAPATRSAHRVHAVGHAHIDSAWLWPVRETVRKVSRTVANVLALMDADPDVTFAFSSAQQFAWLQEFYPELFERVKARVAEGRVLPVGGMWVESDTNMVGSEALVRQFVQGKRFFIDELGFEPTNVWLPDSFGYTGSFPQVAKLAGSPDFLTQKLSWNDTNRIPHHTFWWEGIDGSRVFTHFPPVDTYNSDLSGPELARASDQFAEKRAANTSLVPFGYGDGGGGPTREMVQAAHRAEDLEGSSRVALSTPQGFFDAARAEYADQAPTWVGELYLEYHRGTYTSQSRTKRGNRRSEHLLREAELWATTAAVRTGAAYPAAALQRAWRTVLLQQFHDILPGSSIAWVHREAERNYAEVAEMLEGLIAASLRELVGEAEEGHQVVLNASPFARGGVAALGGGASTAATPATRTPDGEGWVLENGGVRVAVDGRGLVTSVRHLATGREVLPAGTVGNLLQLHRDIPNTWEAWDIDAHYRRNVTDLVEADAVEPDGDAGLRVTRSFSGSRVVQELRLADGDDPTLHLTTHVDWHETQKLLKLAFPLDVHSTSATSEMQFGHVTRPTHVNTSWDAARFETVAHRWVHVGEPGFGVAVANDSSYGHDITRTRSHDGDGDVDGGTVGSTVRITLLRAPLFPDPVADQGEHTFRAAVTFGADVAEAVRQGYAINLPERRVTGAGAGGEIAPLVRVADPQVVVEAVKLAEDGSGDVVVRLYESLGARAATTIALDFPHGDVTVTDLIERPFEGGGAGGAAPASTDDGAVALTLRPFEIVTLRVARG